MDFNGLTDISEIKTEGDSPAAQRIADFVRAAGNPCFFRVKDTPVQVNFCDGAPSLTECLTKMIDQNYQMY